MKNLRALHHVALSVQDVEASADWYTKVLGMTEVFREMSPTRRAVIFQFPDAGWSVAVVEHVGATGTDFSPEQCGLDHFAFSVDSPEELQEWARHFEQLGVTYSPPADVPPGQILNFKDPDGIALALFWDRPTP